MGLFLFVLPVFLQCTPMLSPFHIRNPCGERESFQTRSLGNYKDSYSSLLPAFREQQKGKEKKEKKEKRKAWGLRPHTPLKIKNKRFKPSLLPACREQQGGKEKRQAWGLFAPIPPTRNNVPGPDQWAHRTPDTTQAGDTPTARKHPGQLHKKIHIPPLPRSVNNKDGRMRAVPPS